MPLGGSSARLFEPDFYATSATVIPVLLLALTVQERSPLGAIERSLHNMLEPQIRALEKQEDAIRNATSIGELLDSWTSNSIAPMVSIILRAIVFVAVLIASLSVIVLGIVGEICALLVLSRGAAGPSDRSLVLISVIGLAILTGLSVSMRLGRLYFLQLSVVSGAPSIWYLKLASLIIKRSHGENDTKYTDEGDTPGEVDGSTRQE